MILIKWCATQSDLDTIEIVICTPEICLSAPGSLAGFSLGSFRQIDLREIYPSTVTGISPGSSMELYSSTLTEFPPGTEYGPGSVDESFPR